MTGSTQVDMWLETVINGINVSHQYNNLDVTKNSNV